MFFSFYSFLFLLIAVLSGYSPTNPQFRRWYLLFFLANLGDFYVARLVFVASDGLSHFVLGIPAFCVVFRLEPVVTVNMCGTVFLYLAHVVIALDAPVGVWSVSSVLRNKLVHSLNGNIHGVLIALLVVGCLILLFPGGLLYAITGGDINIMTSPLAMTCLTHLQLKVWNKLPKPVRYFLAAVSNLIVLLCFVPFWLIVLLANVFRPSFWTVPEEKWNLEKEWSETSFGLLDVFDAPIKWVALKNLRRLRMKWPAGATVEPRNRTLWVVLILFPNSLRWSDDESAWVWAGASKPVAPWTPISEFGEDERARTPVQRTPPPQQHSLPADLDTEV